MENIIIYLIVIAAVVVNIVRNYKKEQEKNKGRKSAQQRKPIVTNKPIVDRPFSKKRIDKAQETKENLTNIPSSSIIEYDTLENSYINEEQKSYTKIDESNYQVEDHFGEAFESVDDIKSESSDLRLDTPSDLKAAFVHSLIFERKY